MRFWLIVASVNGFLGVALGALAAHGLKAKLPVRLFEIWEVGVRYHMYHTLAILAVALLAGRLPMNLVSAAGWAFLTGIILFSGSLYALALTNVGKLGAITPFGGVAFLVGWVVLAVAGWRLKP